MNNGVSIFTRNTLRLAGVCVCCGKKIFRNDNTTRVKFCGRCFDDVENERLRLMKLVRQSAILRVIRKRRKELNEPPR